MFRSHGIFVTASMLAFGCETVHHPVATVDAAGAGGAIGSSTATTIGQGGIEATAVGGGTSTMSAVGGATATASAVGGVPTTGGNSMTTGTGQASWAGSGGGPLQGGASPGIGGAATGGQLIQTGGHSVGSGLGGATVLAGQGGSLAAAGRSTQAGGGGTTAFAGGAGQAGNGTCSAEYLACGCGCCGGTDPKVACYYPDRGESLASIIAADGAVKSSTDCEMAGCSLGVRNVCCAAVAPDPGDGSTYTASNYVGALDYLRIEKRNASGNCIALRLARPIVSPSHSVPISLPTDWGIQGGSIRDCNVSAESDTLVGGLGTLTLQGSAANCTLSIHATLFFASGAGPVQAQRFDANNLTIAGGLGAPECP